MPQVHAHRRDPRPVLHRRAHPGRSLPGGDPPARTPAGDDPVLGDLGPDVHRQVGHLAAPGPGHRGAEQPGAAARTPARLVQDHLVRVIGHLQRCPRLPLRPARPAPRPLPQRRRRRLGQPLRRRRPGGIPRGLAQPGTQLRDLRRERPNLLPQHTDLGVLGLDHLAQPGVGSPQRDHLIRNKRNTGHKPSMITISAA